MLEMGKQGWHVLAQKRHIHMHRVSCEWTFAGPAQPSCEEREGVPSKLPHPALNEPWRS